MHISCALKALAVHSVME